jgi:hypothetical protein
VKKTTRSKSVAATQPVIITTAHRGVFFGHANPADFDKPNIRITSARNCISWSRSVGGVFGLASVGPNRECSIGATMAAVTLRDVTAVVECIEAAAKAWKEAPCVS